METLLVFISKKNTQKFAAYQLRKELPFCGQDIPSLITGYGLCYGLGKITRSTKLKCFNFQEMKIHWNFIGPTALLVIVPEIFTLKTDWSVIDPCLARTRR